MSQQPSTPSPSFGRWMGALWLYTLLRLVLFAVLWAIVYLLGVQWLLAALIAAVVSLPLSYVVLAKPRAKLAGVIEQRLAVQHERRERLNTELSGGQDDPDDRDEMDGPGPDGGPHGRGRRRKSR